MLGEYSRRAQGRW